MHYSVELDINLPVQRVVELFDNADNLKQWQPDLISFEHQSGEPGQTGAKSLLKYKMGKRQLEMTETIIARNLPQSFCATYEAKGVWNKVDNHFEALSESATRWSFDCEFQFTGFMRILAFFMPGMFKKQSCKSMQQFKDFAESVG